MPAFENARCNKKTSSASSSATRTVFFARIRWEQGGIGEPGWFVMFLECILISEKTLEADRIAIWRRKAPAHGLNFVRSFCFPVDLFSDRDLQTGGRLQAYVLTIRSFD
jgi:hypothetical protein